MKVVFCNKHDDKYHVSVYAILVDIDDNQSLEQYIGYPLKFKVKKDFTDFQSFSDLRGPFPKEALMKSNQGSKTYSIAITSGKDDIGELLILKEGPKNQTCLPAP